MSNLRGFTRSTKVKVFLAFGALTIGVVVALYFAINSFQQISKSAETLARPNARPVHLSQLLTSLAEAESHLRAYSLTQNQTYLKAYEQDNAEVFKQLSILKQLHQSELWAKRLDTLSTLIHKKVEGLNEFMMLKTQMDQQTFTDKALKRLSQKAEKPVQVNTTLRRTEKAVTKSLPAAPRVHMESVEKKGLLNKIFGKEKKSPVVVMPDSNVITTTKEVSIDTVVLAQPVADSLVSSMRKVLRELQQEESSNRRELSQQELALLAFDQVVMEQIRRTINLMEQDEATFSTNRIQKARRMVDDASLIIFLISCTGLITSFIFVTLIIRDISRSNFYKAQLEKAKRKEEQLRHVKEQFLANMSHEIRTPLNAIVGFSEQLRQQALPETQRKQVDAIRFSSDFLLATVNDILDMSKIEAGQISFEKMDFDLLHLLQQTAGLIENKASEKKLEFSTDLPIAPAFVKGDPFRLQQILYNLLGNAVKFTDSGEVKLKCRVRDNGFGKYLVDITISDSGIGIPSEKLPGIFDSFTQADPSITRRYGGSGLGLAITKKLIDLQGGEINVRSREGKGTIFFTTIPYPKGKPVEQVAPKLEKVPTEWLKNKVLVVDDDPLNVLLLQTILRKWKLPTEVAHSGQEALEKMATAPFDAVLTDMNMPGMSGLQLLQQIRKQPAPYGQVPVVAVTANAIQSDLDRYLAQGMNAYLLKPFREEELLQLLATIWKERNFTTEVSAAPAIEAAQPAAPFPSSTSSKGFSLQLYRKYAAGDTEALRLMITTLLANTEENLLQMKALFQAQDWAQVKELAHKMYPSFKQLKAEKAAHALRQLEIQEKATALQRREWLNELEQEAEQVVAFVNEELGEPSRTS